MVRQKTGIPSPPHTPFYSWIKAKLKKGLTFKKVIIPYRQNCFICFCVVDAAGTYTYFAIAHEIKKKTPTTQDRKHTDSWANGRLPQATSSYGYLHDSFASCTQHLYL
jgi:hypothetical protein